MEKVSEIAAKIDEYYRLAEEKGLVKFETPNEALERTIKEESNNIRNKYKVEVHSEAKAIDNTCNYENSEKDDDYQR